jgi:L-lysine exporter family protein LysE/ArgO
MHAFATLAHSFGFGFLLSLSVCLDLGLVNVAILRTALQHGARQAFMVGLGSCFGDLTYFTLSAFGVSAVLSWMPARWILWLGGTGALLYLTWKMVRDVVRPHRLNLDGPLPPATIAPVASGPSLKRQFGLGLSLALASPTAILWFAAVGGSVIASVAGEERALGPFVAGFFVADVIWSLALAWSAAALGSVAGPKVVRVLSALSAGLFAYLAVVVFLNGIRTLL